MRFALVVVSVAVAVGLFACKPADAPRAPLVDLTPATTLQAARAAFNAHEDQPRFVTLLSPT